MRSPKGFPTDSRRCLTCVQMGRGYTKAYAKRYPLGLASRLKGIRDWHRPKVYPLGILWDRR